MADKLDSLIEKQFGDWSAKFGSDNRLLFAVEQVTGGVVAFADWLKIPPSTLVAAVKVAVTKPAEVPHDR